MNTRQKLTLGIAAIFMVTLTIVGVTYAYFVTRVEEVGANAQVQATTATLATVEYGDGNGLATLKNAIPGEVSEKKTFSVKNNNTDSPAVFSITLQTITPGGKPEFIYASTENEAACYLQDAKPANDENATENCFKDTRYNNVLYRLYEVESDTDNVTGVNPLNPDGSTYELSDTVLGLNVARAEDTLQPLLTNSTIAANDTRYFVLEIYYKDAKANQNIENLAELTVKVDIQ